LAHSSPELSTDAAGDLQGFWDSHQGLTGLQLSFTFDGQIRIPPSHPLPSLQSIEIHNHYDSKIIHGCPVSDITLSFTLYPGMSIMADIAQSTAIVKRLTVLVYTFNAELIFASIVACLPQLSCLRIMYDRNPPMFEVLPNFLQALGSLCHLQEMHWCGDTIINSTTITTDHFIHQCFHACTSLQKIQLLPPERVGIPSAFERHIFEAGQGARVHRDEFD